MRHPGPTSNNLDVEVFNAGGFLTHGDYVLGTDADFFGGGRASVGGCAGQE